MSISRVPREFDVAIHHAIVILLFVHSYMFISTLEHSQPLSTALAPNSNAKSNPIEFATSAPFDDK